MTPHRLALFQPDLNPAPAWVDDLITAGWEVRLCRWTRDIEAFAPTLVIAADAALGKRTGHPWVGWVREEPARLRTDRRRLDTVLSHDGFLVESGDQARFLTDSLSPTERSAQYLSIDDLTPAALARLADSIRASAGFAPAPADDAGPTIDYIVRVGGRDIRFVRRCLDSLAAQTVPGVGAILVRHGPVAGLEELMAACRPHLRRLSLLDVAGPTTRSACLWAGLAAVEADLFGMLDDDDALHPNHVASLAPMALAGSVAIAGSVQVWDDAGGPFPPTDPRAEHRAFHLLPPADRAGLFGWQVVVHSSAFLAPSSLLPMVGPDPALDFAEDSFLIRRLARAAPLAASWRVSTDFHWRQGQADNTAFRPEGRQEAMARIADRERLDPVITEWRSRTVEEMLAPPPAWGQPADSPDLPRLADAAAFHALPGERPLYIYGAGRGGRIVLGEVTKHPHLTVTGILDSRTQGTAFGLPLLRPADVPPDHLGKAIFIIASEHLTAMTETLRSLGAVHIHDATPHIRLYTALPG
ncbi:glycosyltransferase [Niveispirillum irakense]|uniref:glycosyltransferase n=1 Tax=Niveispirillum irakense TaxID=34011 RepID=UPI00041DDC87|nr:glycosyltransferase family A protein [Niveispirillum irakense]